MSPVPQEAAAPNSKRVNGVALPSGYTGLWGSPKVQVRQAQFRAQRVVDEQLIELYWSIGREILTQQTVQRLGTGVVGRLAGDLRAEFPQTKGFSASNL